MKYERYCTTCPQECLLTIVRLGENASITVSGNRCPRGAKFAQEELTCPMRVLTTTVRCVTKDGTALLPVRTQAEIPLHLHPAVMEDARTILVRSPVKMGDVIWANVAGTQVNLIASRDI